MGEANGNRRPPDGNRRGLRVRVLKRIKGIRIKYKQRKHKQWHHYNADPAQFVFF